MITLNKSKIFTSLLFLNSTLFFTGCGGEDSRDSSPNSFTFTDNTAVALATYITSNAITVSGFDNDAEISISGGYYSIDGSAYTNETGTVESGQVITVKLLSSNKLSTTTSAILTVGDQYDTFSVKTVGVSLSVRNSFKGMTFDWPYVSGAVTYKILEKTHASTTEYDDSLEGYEQVGRTVNNDSTALTLEFPIHLHDWLHTLYKLETCTDDECSSTAAVSAATYVKSAIGYIKAPNPDALDNYSIVAVSADGQTLAVGAPGEDSSATRINGDTGDNALDGSGAVYVYRKTDGKWAFEAYIKAPNADEGDRFGSTISLSSNGNTLAIGAPQEDSASTHIDTASDDNTATNAGAVYVFNRSGSTWLQQGYLKATNAESQDFFGSSLALSATGATLAIGAPLEDSTSLEDNFISDTSSTADEEITNNDAVDAGAVYIFSLNGDSWVQSYIFKSPNAATGDQFGTSLSISANGNSLAVGSPRQYSNGDFGSFSSGAAYLFSRTNSQWELTSTLQPDVASEDLKFGSALSLSANGHWLAVGAPGDSSSDTGVHADSSNTGTIPSETMSSETMSSGAIYMYSNTYGGWQKTHYLKSSNSDAGDRFGASLALNSDGTVLVAGAPGEASQAEAINGDEFDNTKVLAGAAYSFVRETDEWEQIAYIKAPSPHADDAFGSCIATDASGTLLAVGAPGEKSKNPGVGASQYDTSLAAAGAVYLY